MIESPLIKEIVAESKQEDIREVLQARFGTVPEQVDQRLRTVHSEKKLKALIKHAAKCSNLDAFRERLP